MATIDDYLRLRRDLEGMVRGKRNAAGIRDMADRLFGLGCRVGAQIERKKIDREVSARLH